jgi:spore coat protein CotH
MRSTVFVLLLGLGLAVAGCDSGPSGGKGRGGSPGAGGAGGSGSGGSGFGGSGGGGGGTAGTPGGGSGGGGPAGGTGGSPTAGRDGGTPTGGTGGSPTAGRDGGPPTGGTGGSPTAGRDGGTPTGGTGGAGPVGGMGGMGLPNPPGSDKHGTLVNGGGITSSVMSFQDKVYDIQITVAPADFTRLNMNAELYDATGMYVPATVRIDGTDRGPVGIRYKGNWGTFRNCLQGATGAATGGGIVPANPIGECTNQFAMKIAFDHADPMKKWNGLKKINLHSHLRDQSKMREKLTFQMFRDMGVATARSTHAKVTLTVGGASVVMLYGLTENMGDGRFGEDHWPAFQNGNIYKQAWPTYVFDDYFVKRLETNNDPPPPLTIHDQIKGFANEVYRNRDKTDVVYAALEKWSDVEWLARVIAVDTVSMNTDGLTKFWCPAAGPKVLGAVSVGCDNNNFFWFQTAQNKFLLMPWDVDYSWYPVSDHRAIPPWDAPVANCMQTYPVYGSNHMAPSCDPVFKAMNLPAPRALYIKAIKDMLAGPFAAAKVEADLNRWVAYIKPALAATTMGVVGGITIRGNRDTAGFDAAVAQLKAGIQTLRQRATMVANSSTPMPFPRQ